MLQHIELGRATLELLTFCHNGVKSTLEPVQYLQDVVKVKGLREIEDVNQNGDQTAVSSSQRLLFGGICWSHLIFSCKINIENDDFAYYKGIL